MRRFFALAALTGTAFAQSGPYAQCGGKNWDGAKTCVSGWKCTVINDWYSQCLVGSDSPDTTLITSQTTASPTSPTSTTKAPEATPKDLWWFGTNESGGEFGEGTLPGLWGKHFIFPSTSAIDVNQPTRFPPRAHS